jgi:hypothetical protein
MYKMLSKVSPTQALATTLGVLGRCKAQCTRLSVHHTQVGILFHFMNGNPETQKGSVICSSPPASDRTRLEVQAAFNQHTINDHSS